jgi:hypothetical protein
MTEENVPIQPRSGAEVWEQMRAAIAEIHDVLEREQVELDLHRNVSATGLWTMATELYAVRHETQVLGPETRKAAPLR